MARFSNELTPSVIGIGVAAPGDERLVFQTFGHHHVAQRVDQRHVGARAQRQVLGLAQVGCFQQVDAARVGDDQLRPLAQALAHH